MLRWLGIGCILFSLQAMSQEDRFYIRVKNANFEIPLITQDSIVTYKGDDARIAEVFNQYDIKVFRKGFKYAERSKLKRTYFGIASSPNFKKDLLVKAGDIFEFGESLDKDVLKIYEPNDYGTTSTIGKSLGAPVNLDYFDFVGIPQAWYYTTGKPQVIIGISDGYVDPEDPEFKGRLTEIRKSSGSQKHGTGVAATAAASGDNGYASTGVCYNCSVYTTTYGDFRELKQLLELARAGVKVINCSWGQARYYETAQEVINEIRDLGTVIVSVPHNISYSKTKGKRKYYPGAYEHVISVGTVQHTYDNIEDGLRTSEKTGDYYAERQRYHVGRTGRFKNNDPSKEYILYLSSTNNLDESVDILAPGNGIFRYQVYAETGQIDQNIYNHTSPAAPIVTGTIGLMFSLNPCLSVDEVNTLIRLSATNIDFVKANAPLRGKYGAGSLHAGRAVQMTHHMLKEDETVLLENQSYNRWNFTLKAPYNIALRNERFTDSARVKFTAKRQIILGPETVLLPDNNGSVQLTIDPTSTYNCKDLKE